MNENQRDHNHARLGEHNGGDYDMRHQTQPCVSQTAESESQPTLTALRETQAALARKDALLRKAMEALQGCVPVTFSDVTLSRRAAAIAAIEAELSQSPAPVAAKPHCDWPDCPHGSDCVHAAPVAVQPSQWQISGELCEVGDIVEDTAGFRILLPNERMGRIVEVTGLHRSEVPRLGLFSNVVLSLSASPEDKPKCLHHFVRDDDNIEHHCCQKCGKVVKDKP